MRKHKCSLCEKEFDSGTSLGSHVRTHTRKLVECDICHLAFGERALSVHRETCAKKEASSHRECKKCGKEYVSHCREYCSRLCANSRSHTEKTKEKISQSVSSKFPGSRGPKPCKYCGSLTEPVDGKAPKNYCLPMCEAAKQHKSSAISLSVKGKTGGYRERGGRGNGSRYKGVWMDSTWERRLAERLDEVEISWERDLGKHVFIYQDESGKERRYFPDFYLPAHDLYIEVKGYWTKQTRHKMKDVISRNKDARFLVLESLKQIEEFDL